MIKKDAKIWASNVARKSWQNIVEINKGRQYLIPQITMHPDSKVHGVNIGPIWGRQYPGEPHVGPMNFALWGTLVHLSSYQFFFHIENTIFL